MKWNNKSVQHGRHLNYMMLVVVKISFFYGTSQQYSAPPYCTAAQPESDRPPFDPSVQQHEEASSHPSPPLTHPAHTDTGSCTTTEQRPNVDKTKTYDENQEGILRGKGLLQGLQVAFCCSHVEGRGPSPGVSYVSRWALGQPGTSICHHLLFLKPLSCIYIHT